MGYLRSLLSWNVSYSESHNYLILHQEEKEIRNAKRMNRERTRIQTRSQTEVCRDCFLSTKDLLRNISEISVKDLERGGELSYVLLFSIVFLQLQKK